MQSLRIRTVLLALPALLVLSLSAANAQGAKKNLLVISFCGGFKHGSIPLGIQTITQLGEKTGEWTVDEAATAEEVAAKTTPEALKKYDGVVFNNNTGIPPVADKAAFIQWIKDGHALIGMHAGCDRAGKGQEWPELVEMIGAQFRTHHSQCEVTALVLDHKNPANEKLDATWSVRDEIYLLRDCDLSKLHLLVYMDKHPMDNAKDEPGGAPGIYPVSWIRDYGKGRVFFTIFGHRDEVWKDPKYQEHITGGIEWALGLKQGDARPQMLTGLWAQ